MVGAERRERPADRDAAVAADARRRPRRTPASAGRASRSSSTSRRASIARASSPPDATLPAAAAARRGWRRAGTRTSSPGSVAAHVDAPRVAFGMASSARCARTGGRQRRRGRAPATRRPRAACASTSAVGRGADRASSAAARSLVALELGQPGAGLVAVHEHVGERLAVLAAQVVQQLAPLADSAQPLRVVLDALAGRAQLGGDVGQLGRDARRRASTLGERAPVARRAASAVPSASAAPPSSRAPRLRPPRPRGARRRRRAASSSAARRSSSSGSSRRRRRARRPGTAAGRSRGPAPVRRRRARRARASIVGQPGARGAQRLEVDRAERGRARRAARRGASSDWCACCPWRSTSRSPQLGQRRRPGPAGRRRRRASAPRRARPGTSTTSSSPTHEAALDGCLGRAGPHQRGVGAAAHQQLDGLDEHRLAGAGLARQRGHAPAPSTRRSSAMTPRSRDGELDAASAVAQPELGLEDAVEVARRRSETSARRVGGRCRRRASPSASSPRLRPSTDSVAGRCAARPRGATVVSGSKHHGAVEQHVRRHRREEQGPVGRARRSGPRAESE